MSDFDLDIVTFLFSRPSSYALSSHTTCNINLLQSIGFKAVVKERVVISEGCGERKIQILEVSPKAVEEMYKEGKSSNSPLD